MFRKWAPPLWRSPLVSRGRFFFESGGLSPRQTNTSNYPLKAFRLNFYQDWYLELMLTTLIPPRERGIQILCGSSWNLPSSIARGWAKNGKVSVLPLLCIIFYFNSLSSGSDIFIFLINFIFRLIFSIWWQNKVLKKAIFKANYWGSSLFKCQKDLTKN